MQQQPKLQQLRAGLLLAAATTAATTTATAAADNVQTKPLAAAEATPACISLTLLLLLCLPLQQQ